MKFRSLETFWRIATGTALALAFGSPAVHASSLSSYPMTASDIVGATGASAVALGPPDYAFVNDAAEAFGGTNTDVFEVGETAQFDFATPLRAISGQHDLIVSAFVGGVGATDNATVQVEVSSDGTNFVTVSTFDTQSARDREQDEFENDFEGVKLFYVDFGSEDNVIAVRITNMGGTAEGLRLDAVEGLHPDTDRSRAFEIRFDRHRPDFFMFFSVRIKNIAGPTGVPIREFRMTRSELPGVLLEDTEEVLFSADGNGQFICVENCIPNAGPMIPFSRHAWSTDGLVEAPAGQGLAPGRQAAHLRYRYFDIDNGPYLEGMEFAVTFADGVVHSFTYDEDVQIAQGMLYQKYLYFEPEPEDSGPRTTDYYQFVGQDDPPEPPAVPSMHPGSMVLLTGLLAGLGGLRIRGRREQA